MAEPVLNTVIYPSNPLQNLTFFPPRKKSGTATTSLLYSRLFSHYRTLTPPLPPPEAQNFTPPPYFTYFLLKL